MAELVYILCTATSLICAFLTWRGYKRNGMPMLFWSSMCFVGFALNNAILFIDEAVVPEVSLSTWRLIPALFGVSALVYGFVRKDAK
jgi:hypothetical protein